MKEKGTLTRLSAGSRCAVSKRENLTPVLTALFILPAKYLAHSIARRDTNTASTSRPSNLSKKTDIPNLSKSLITGKTLMENTFDQELIAPCGMNCGICTAYLREKNKCPGCRAADTNKAISVLRCKIKNCEVIRKGKAKFCFGCENYACKDLKHLDKRYRTKYRMSMIENLNDIKKNGISWFLDNEKKRWECPTCGGVICCHRGICFDCRKEKK